MEVGTRPRASGPGLAGRAELAEPGRGAGRRHVGHAGRCAAGAGGRWPPWPCCCPRSTRWMRPPRSSCWRGIFYGAQYGGSTTSILLNVPGEASSVMTAVDGHAMARQGRAGVALAVAALGSFVAGTVGTAVVALLAAPLSAVALTFGPRENFALLLFGLVSSVVLVRGSLLKGPRRHAAGHAARASQHRPHFGRGALQHGLGGTDRRHWCRGGRDGCVRHRRSGVVAGSGGQHKAGQRASGRSGLAYTAGLGPGLAGPAAWHDGGHAAGAETRQRACDGVVHGLCAGEEVRRCAGRTCLGTRQPARRGGARSGQQRCGASLLHPDAHARHSDRAGDGHAGSRVDDQGHRSRAAGDDRQPRTVLGTDRVDVGGQPDAAGVEPAPGGAVGQPLARTLPAALPGDPGLQLHRAVLGQQHGLRGGAGRVVRAAGRGVAQVGQRHGTAGPGLCPGRAHRGEPAPITAAVPR
jgi:hypothetical protein